jgi:hypothetical protein
MNPSFLLVLPLTCAACGAQLDSTYDGEAIATLYAEVTTPPTTATPRLAAAFWWTGIESAVLARVDVEVTGAFPVAMTLQLTQPPPDDVLIEAHGPRFACEPLILIGRDETGNSAHPRSIYGVTEHHVVCYMKDPIVAGSAPATMLGSAYEPGFHVIALEHRPRWLEAQEQGTLSEWQDALEQCIDDFVAVHEGAQSSASHSCDADIPHATEDDLDTVMPISVGEFLFPRFDLEA